MIILPHPVKSLQGFSKIINQIETSESIRPTKEDIQENSNFALLQQKLTYQILLGWEPVEKTSETMDVYDTVFLKEAMEGLKDQETIEVSISEIPVIKQKKHKNLNKFGGSYVKQRPLTPSEPVKFPQKFQHFLPPKQVDVVLGGLNGNSLKSASSTHSSSFSESLDNSSNYSNWSSFRKNTADNKLIRYRNKSARANERNGGNNRLKVQISDYEFKSFNHHQQYADDYRTQVVEPELIQYNEQQESKSSDYYFRHRNAHSIPLVLDDNMQISNSGARKISANVKTRSDPELVRTVPQAPIPERLWTMPRYPTISIPTGKTYKPELQIAGESKSTSGGGGVGGGSSSLLGNRHQMTPPTTQYRHSSSPQLNRKGCGNPRIIDEGSRKNNNENHGNQGINCSNNIGINNRNTRKQGGGYNSYQTNTRKTNQYGVSAKNHRGGNQTNNNNNSSVHNSSTHNSNNTRNNLNSMVSMLRIDSQSAFSQQPLLGRR